MKCGSEAEPKIVVTIDDYGIRHVTLADGSPVDGPVACSSTAECDGLGCTYGFCDLSAEALQAWTGKGTGSSASAGEERPAGNGLAFERQGDVMSLNAATAERYMDELCGDVDCAERCDPSAEWYYLQRCEAGVCQHQDNRFVADWVHCTQHSDRHIRSPQC